MHITRYIPLLFSLSIFSQEDINTTYVDKTEFKIDKIIQIDNFQTKYFTKDNIFYLKNSDETINYSNVQLGEITSVDAFNSLKINVFYRDFNTAIILDNRLAVITKIDFNSLEPFRNVTHISSANDNRVWLYNQNTQQIELFDYFTNKTRTITQPMNGEVLDLVSNYNFCWLLTNEFIYVYNYIGSLIEKFPNDGFTNIEENNENLVLLKENQLFFKANNSSQIKPIKHGELLINQFFVTDETLYIYDGEFLHRYLIKTN